MLEIIFSIFTNVLMLPISFFIGLMINYTKDKVIIKRFQKKIGFIKEQDKYDVIVFTANPNVKDNNEYVNLGYTFEYMAVAELRNKLIDIYNKELIFTLNMSNINYHNIRKKSLIRNNTVLIGGPIHNSVVSEFFFKEPNLIPFYFEEDCTLVFDNGENKERFTPQLSKNDVGDKYFEEDFALILNTQNPIAKEKRVLAIMGCRSVGCYGGTVFVSDCLDKCKEIKNTNYALVVRCLGEEENLISKPELVRYYSLDKA